MNNRITALFAVFLLTVAPLHAALGATAWDIYPTPLDRMNKAGIETTVTAIVYVLENSSDEELRYWSALALAQLEDRKAIPHLISTTDDASALARLGAAIALGHFRAPESTKALSTLAAQDPEHAARKAAVISLGKIRGNDAAVSLIQTAKNEEESKDIRYHAIAVLGDFGERAAMTKLLPLADNPDPNIRAAARLSLSKRGVPVAIDDLIVSATNDDVSSPVSIGLIRHLEQMSGRSFINPEDPDEIADAQRRISLWWANSTGAQNMN